jgi:hypothetical protein
MISLISVMYFSTKILGPVFRDSSKLVALFVMAIGIPFNFVPGCLPQVREIKWSAADVRHSRPSGCC